MKETFKVLATLFSIVSLIATFVQLFSDDKKKQDFTQNNWQRSPITVTSTSPKAVRINVINCIATDKTDSMQLPSPMLWVQVQKITFQNQAYFALQYATKIKTGRNSLRALTYFIFSEGQYKGLREQMAANKDSTIIISTTIWGQSIIDSAQEVLTEKLLASSMESRLNAQYAPKTEDNSMIDINPNDVFVCSFALSPKKQSIRFAKAKNGMPKKDDFKCNYYEVSYKEFRKLFVE